MAYYSSATPAAVASLSLILLIVTITGCGGLPVAADICPAMNHYLCHRYSFNTTSTQAEVFKTLHESTNNYCVPASYNDRVFQITVWRYVWCRDGLGDAECKTCFNNALANTIERCPLYTQGAQYRTEDCCVRYEIYDFCSFPGHE